MKEFIPKYMPYITASLIIYFSPIIGDLVFVGSLVVFDWFTGILKGLKNHNFKSDLAIRKFWVSIGYLLGLMVVRAVELHYGLENETIVKPVVAIITVAELQSLRENFKDLTGMDILKPVINIFKKK